MKEEQARKLSILVQVAAIAAFTIVIVRVRAERNEALKQLGIVWNAYQEAARSALGEAPFLHADGLRSEQVVWRQPTTLDDGSCAKPGCLHHVAHLEDAQGHLFAWSTVREFCWLQKWVIDDAGISGEYECRALQGQPWTSRDPGGYK